MLRRLLLWLQSLYMLNSVRFLLGDVPLCRMFLPINAPSHPTTLCHLCTFLLIIANSRQSTLVALIAESNGHMT